MSAANNLGILTCEDVVTQEIPAIEFLGVLGECGGTWEFADGVREWDIQPLPASHLLTERIRRVSPDFVLPGDGAASSGVMGVGGIVAIAFRGERYFLTEVKVLRRDGLWVPVVALLGPSRDAALRVFATVWARLAVHRPRVRVWGGGALQFTDLVPVREEEIVLSDELKSSSLAYIDRFWHLRSRAAELGISGRRGILLVGPPGCGKTLFVRHVLTRLADARAHLFLAERMGSANPTSPFSDMLDSVRRSSVPSVVVLEDIDRLTDSGVVTKEFLLNALDGMLATGQWVLWIATSNDPRGLEDNLLDRPGRFDRVVLFPAPAARERRELVRLHSPLDIDQESLNRAAANAEGLSGAHIREACHAAALEAIETRCTYGPIVVREIERMREQHERARSYDCELGRRRAGF